MKVELYGLTDVGQKRQYNEDNFFCIELPGGPPAEKKVEPSNNDSAGAALLVVADGIGGHAGGDTASTLAVDVLRRNVTGRFQPGEPGISDYRPLLEDTILEANSRIFSQASQEPNLVGMGTTVVAALVVDSMVLVSNVGDSRAYLIRRRRINQITDDHSWKAEQRRLKMLSEQEILSSPFRHTITRSLGFSAEVSVDTFLVDLRSGDYLLLCSDGLYESLPDFELLKIVLRSKKPDKICSRLIKSANRRGGHDNITAVVARITGKRKNGSPASDTFKRTSGSREADRRNKDTVELPEPPAGARPKPSDTVKIEGPHKD